MLAIAVEFLTGRSVATAFADRDETEWPPHPARLFSALVDTWAEAGKDEAEEEALRWLERQPPPALRVSQATVRPPRTVFVPPNDVRGAQLAVLPERRSRQPRTFPSATPLEPEVELLWRDAEPAAAVREALESIARRVARLGHSSSLVALRVLDHSDSEPDLVPSDHGELLLRVPEAGQLDALERAYEVYVGSGIRGQLPCGFQAYGTPGVDPITIPSSAFDEMIVFRRAARSPQLPIEAAPRAAAQLRAAAMSAAGDGAPEVLTGHVPGGGRSERPHVAYIALPDVGHPHADGHLLGVAAVLPRELTAEDRATVYRALLDVTHLNLGTAGRWELERIGLDVPARGLQPATWRGPAPRWVTATPLELDGFPDAPYGDQACALVAAACERIGLPAPVNVVLGADSFVAGSPPWGAFARWRPRTDRPRRPLVHAALDFEAPVEGPLLIGAGRYRGLGLCRPLR